jgi:predicted transcriptional regulator
MRLDHDLVRTLLKKIGDLPFDGGFHDVSVEGRSGEEISYHIMLLHQAGLIEAIDVGSHDGVCWRPKHLTYAGNEFLAAAESDTVWNKAKSIVWQSSKTITLEALKHALPLAVKALIPGAP